MDIDLDQLKAIFTALAEHDIDQIEYEDSDARLIVTRRSAGTNTPVYAAAPVAHASATPAQGGERPAATSASSTIDDGSVFVESPFVGTFYRASSPDADAFTDVGKQIKKGQTLCIVEAMKLMNEIESELNGEVLEVLVENGKPVEYGDRLFRIKPA